MDIETALFVAIAALASSLVVLWKYTEARLDRVVVAYNERIDRVVSTYTEELLRTRKEHRAEIAALATRLDAAEEGRRLDAVQHGHELRGLAERSIAAHHESSQAIRSMVNAVQRVPYQNAALTPMEMPEDRA